MSIFGNQAIASFVSDEQVPVKRRIRMRMNSGTEANFFISFSLVLSDNIKVILRVLNCRVLNLFRSFLILSSELEFG